jgi:hypothetical protein
VAGTGVVNLIAGFEASVARYQLDAGFVSAGNVNVGYDNQWGVAPDLNGDGIPDLIVNFDNVTSAVFLGRARGSVPYGAPILLDAGGIGEYFAPGDLNGDGRIDIAQGGYNGLTVFLNTCAPQGSP